MANWRRKILSLFPELRYEAQRPNSSIYLLFYDLRQISLVAHKAGDDETLRRVYGFAEWCSEQRAEHLWNAAGVAFYEHLFDDHPTLWADVVQWLPPKVMADCWGLWEWRLLAETLAEVKRLFATRRRARHLEARLTSGRGGHRPREEVDL